MYMHEPAGADTWAELSWGARIALAVAVLVTLGLGVYPLPVLELARQATASL
jgi:NADH:ubiquinone oxidoreductase subunit 2 (subunit N)